MRHFRLAAVLLAALILFACVPALAASAGEFSVSAQGIELADYGGRLYGEYDADTSWITLAYSGIATDTDVTIHKSQVKFNGRSEFYLNYGVNKLRVSAGGCTRYVYISRALPKSDDGAMSPLERTLAELALTLMPETHPFVRAYEAAWGVDIKSYTVKKRGKTISGIPFEYGGGGDVNGFRSRWWGRTGVSQYPVGGLDCAEYMVWIYRQAGYDIPSSSSRLFLSGVTGVEQKVPGVRTHYVLASLTDALIGDIAYNSQYNTYRSGHGNHTVMFLGTAQKLGIADELSKYYADFPNDAYLVAECGFSDGGYYYKMMRSIGVSGRSSMCGTGVMFFTSIKGNDGEYLYKSPLRDDACDASYSYTDEATGSKHTVGCGIERHGRPFQYRAYKSSPCDFVMNLSRPIVRSDG